MTSGEDRHRFVVSHPFRQRREMDGAPEIYLRYAVGANVSFVTPVASELRNPQRLMKIVACCRLPTEWAEDYM